MPLVSLTERSLLVFNFLPSTTLHPSRLPDREFAPYIAALAATPAAAPMWHRHWSRLILRREGLLETPVTDAGATGLAVAVLLEEALTTLARRIGLVLCAPRLRYAISGEAVRALQAALGTDAWRWVKDGATMHRGLPGPMFKNADDAVRNVDRAGYAALYTAFQSATQEVARRFVLKLPCSLSPRVGQDGAPDDRSCQTATTTIEREVAAAIDSETAMSLAMALYAALDSGGENGIFA